MNKSQNLDLFTGLKYIMPSYPFCQNGMTDFPTLSYTWTSEIAYPFISLKPEKVPLSYTFYRQVVPLSGGTSLYRPSYWVPARVLAEAVAENLAIA